VPKLDSIENGFVGQGKAVGFPQELTIRHHRSRESQPPQEAFGIDPIEAGEIEEVEEFAGRKPHFHSHALGGELIFGALTALEP